MLFVVVLPNRPPILCVGVLFTSLLPNKLPVFVCWSLPNKFAAGLGVSPAGVDDAPLKRLPPLEACGCPAGVVDGNKLGPDDAPNRDFGAAGVVDPNKVPEDEAGVLTAPGVVA